MSILETVGYIKMNLGREIGAHILLHIDIHIRNFQNCLFRVILSIYFYLEVI